MAEKKNGKRKSERMEKSNSSGADDRESTKKERIIEEKSDSSERMEQKTEINPYLRQL